MTRVTIITRYFQPGAGPEEGAFDLSVFEKRAAEPIRRILKYDIVRRVIIVSNGEIGNTLAERLIPGTNQTPTVRAMEKVFPREVEERRIVTHVCKDWGDNPGSATALNEGSDLAAEFGAEWILNWSPEIEMDGLRILDALDFAKANELQVVGFLRESYWEKLQWRVVQNTAALWHLASLRAIGGFSRECNGTGETIYIEPFGEVPIAGMEDFHTLLRFLKDRPGFRWGMIGRANPVQWNTDFEVGSEREQRHLRKVARQLIVMEKYTYRIFPEKPFNEVINMLFSRHYSK